MVRRRLVRRGDFDDRGSLPGAAQNIMLIGIGFGSCDCTVPVTDSYRVLSALSTYCGS